MQAELDGPLSTGNHRSTRASAPSEPTASDLLALLAEMKDAEILDVSALPPMEAWKEIMESVEALAAKAGGLANLKRCIAPASFAALVK